MTKAFSEDPFILKHYQAVDNFLLTLKFITGQFVTSKMIEKFYNALFTDDDILFSD